MFVPLRMDTKSLCEKSRGSTVQAKRTICSRI